MPPTISPPPGSRYVDQRHYVVPVSLADLRGPTSGVVTLDRWLDWSGDSTYDLDDTGDLQVMYQTVLNQAASVEDLCRWLNGDTLCRLWPSLWLPTRLRALWQTQFSELPTTLRGCPGRAGWTSGRRGHGREGGVQDVQSFVQQVIADHERGQEPEHVAVRAAGEHHQSGGMAGGGERPGDRRIGS